MTHDPKYTSPDDEGFRMTFPQYPDPSVSKKPVGNVTITTANTTGDYPIRVNQSQALVLDLQAALTNIRNEINYINSIAGSPGYVADGCQHALNYLSTADDAAAKLSRMLER